MHKRLIAGFLAGIAILAGSPGNVLAHADTVTTWTVSPGGTARATAIPGTITLTDMSTASVGTCKSSKVTGTVKAGSGLSGQDIAAVTAAAFKSCAAQGAIPMTVSSQSLPWRISFTSYDAKTHVVLGTVSGVEVTLAGTSALCSAMVNGSSGPAADGVVSAIYNDRTGQLTFLSGGSNLHYWHVKHCYQLINNGDPVTLAGSYTIRPIQDITGP